MLIDSHAHLQFDTFNADRNEVIKKCLDHGIFVINVGTQKETSRRAVELAHRYPQNLYAAAGLHPGHLEPDAYHDREESNSLAYEEFDYDFFKNLAQDPAVVAIGETGLDYYRLSKEESEKGKEERIKILQQDIFQKHIELAIELKKPLIIHCRSAHPDCLELLAFHFSTSTSRSPGVIHSFGGTVDDARRYRAMGFKIAFNGIITFSHDYDGVIKDTPLEDLLVETDCPYLTPVPHRGKRNEPSYVGLAAQKIAEIKGISFDEVARQTTENAKRLFGI